MGERRLTTATRIARPAAAALIIALVAMGGALSAKPRASHRAGATAQTPKPAGFVVAVVGGGFADALAEGLRDDLADQPEVTILADGHAKLGLAGPAEPDASGIVRTLLAGRHIDAVALMPSADDVKPLPDGATQAEPGTPRWRTLYGNRIDALLATFAASHVPVLWVGLPIVADDQLASTYALLNEIALERVAKGGIPYVDSWAAFADEGGRFASNGPDTSGRIVRLRAADGRAFSRAGGAKLASFLEPLLRRLRMDAALAAAQATPVILPSAPDVDTDIDAQIRRELGLPPLAAAGQGAPSSDSATAVIVTAPPTAPDGQLLAAVIGPPPLPGTAASLAQRVLVEGRPIAPRPGRMDDFAWPRR